MKIVLQFVGGAVALLAIVASTLQLWHMGFFGYVVPVQERVAQPVKLAIHGPKEVLAGSEAVFAVEVSGTTGVPQIKMIPDRPAAFTILADHKTIKFNDREPGLYVISASVAGDGNAVANDALVFENLDYADSEPEPTPSPVDVNALKALIDLSSHSKQPAEPTVEEMTRDSLNAHVESPSKADEARVLAGVFRQIANRIKTGQVLPDADVLAELEDQFDLALGENSHAWRVFLSDVRVIIMHLREKGVVTTAPSMVPALEEMANALSSFH